MRITLCELELLGARLPIHRRPTLAITARIIPSTDVAEPLAQAAR